MNKKQLMSRQKNMAPSGRDYVEVICTGLSKRYLRVLGETCVDYRDLYIYGLYRRLRQSRCITRDAIMGLCRRIYNKDVGSDQLPFYFKDLTKPTTEELVLFELEYGFNIEQLLRNEISNFEDYYQHELH